MVKTNKKKRNQFLENIHGKRQGKMVSEKTQPIAPFNKTEYGKQWRKDLQNGRLNKEQWQQIPQELRQVCLFIHI